MSELTSELPTDQKVLMNVVSLNTAVNDLQKEQAHDHKILFEGNGEIPIVQQVKINTEFIAGIKKLMWIIGGAILAQTVTFGTVAVVLFIRVMPILTKLASGEIVIVPK